MLVLSVISRHIFRTNKFHFTSRNMSRPPLQMTALCREIVPPLSHDLHKGQNGRIGVLGGSSEYAGAPYFAAITAMKTGADLAYVFCPAAETSPVIKSYSPELIVHTLHTDRGGAKEQIIQHMPKLHALVIGPGLGLDWVVGQDIVRPVIQKAREMGLPLIIDADGLSVVTAHPETISGYTKAILTPNAVEFNRLFEKVDPTIIEENKECRINRTVALSKALGNVTIVHKGATDVISNGVEYLESHVSGSMRRCGGQGDLLSGSCGLFSYWAHQALQRQSHMSETFKKYGATITAGYCASLLTRGCSQQAFEENGRSMMTSDMIKMIPNVFKRHFEYPEVDNETL